MSAMARRLAWGGGTGMVSALAAVATESQGSDAACEGPAGVTSFGSSPKVKLERVVVLTRHGDRTPAFWADRKNRIGRLQVSAAESAFWSLDNGTIIPTSEAQQHWSRYSPWQEHNAPSVTGTLTWLGAAAHLANGVWLRQRYVSDLGYLPPTLSPGDVVTRSTPFPRCVQSAQNLLIGLYPPADRPSSPMEASLTPIETNTRGYEPMYGIWFASADSCPRSIQLLTELYITQEAAMSADDRALEARVKAETGANPNGQLALADAIRCQQQYGLPLIAGWSDEFATQVRDYAWRTFMERYRHPEFLGLMMKQLLPELEKALLPHSADTVVGPKISIFSGHDACPMMPAMVGLGVWDGSWPDYATMCILEVVSLPSSSRVSSSSSSSSSADRGEDYFVQVSAHDVISSPCRCLPSHLSFFLPPPPLPAPPPRPPLSWYCEHHLTKRDNTVSTSQNAWGCVVALWASSASTNPTASVSVRSSAVRLQVAPALAMGYVLLIASSSLRARACRWTWTQPVWPMQTGRG